MTSKKEKIKESLENGIKELEEAKERVKAVEDEKDYINEQHEVLNNEHQKLINEYDDLVERNKAYEKELDNNEKLINDLKVQVEHTDLLESRILKYKEEFSNLNLELDDIAGDNKALKDTQKALSDEVYNLKTNNISLQNRIKELEEKNKKANEIEFKYKNMKEMYNESESNYKSYINQYNKLRSDYDEVSIRNNLTCESINNLKRTNANLSSDLEGLTNENLRLKNENLKILLECDRLKSEASGHQGSHNKLTNQLDNLNKTYKNLEAMYNTARIEKEELFSELSRLKEVCDNRNSEVKMYIGQLNQQTGELNYLENTLKDYE
jgi:chromosome segregation ATPase